MHLDAQRCCNIRISQTQQPTLEKNNTMTKKPSSLISINDLTNEQVLSLFKTADEIQQDKNHFFDTCKNKILALLFFEPSTRTYFSFSSAMHRLGGSVIGFSQTESTSVAKGESLEDTAKVMSYYSDLMVIRHPEIGAVQKIANVTQIPIINGGEGAGEHPTQTLYDLYTIYKNFNRLDVTIGLYGDLKFSRPNHSLMLAASRFGANFVCIAPDELQMPDSYIETAKRDGAKVTITDNVKTHLKNIDVLYVSRLQKERLPSNIDPDYFKHNTAVNKELLSHMNETTIIMHPLPRIDEIHREIDDDLRAKYFEQAANGVPVRMAVILFYLGIK